ncbi:MAG: hypothetical protein C0603_09510 [Denitrovibrio sp.]|nr:MAG: hypothetical protein C0603_09510 [Denitrovibrio sp.]
MKNLSLIIVTLVLLTFGCVTTEQPTKINYYVVHAGKEFSKPLRGARVFNSEAEYRDFLMARAIKAHDMFNNFDFTTKSMLVVYLGKKGEDGYGLKIKSIESGSEIIVRATETAPAESDAPQFFIGINKTDKKAKLIIE